MMIFSKEKSTKKEKRLKSPRLISNLKTADFFFKHFFATFFEVFMDPHEEELFPIQPIFLSSKEWGKKRKYCEIEIADPFIDSARDLLNSNALFSVHKSKIPKKYLKKVSKQYSSKLRRFLTFQFLISESFVKMYREEHPNPNERLKELLSAQNPYVHALGSVMRDFCLIMPKHCKKEAIQNFKKTGIYKELRRVKREKKTIDQKKLIKIGTKGIMPNQHQIELQRKFKTHFRDF